MSDELVNIPATSLVVNNSKRSLKTIGDIEKEHEFTKNEIARLDHSYDSMLSSPKVLKILSQAKYENSKRKQKLEALVAKYNADRGRLTHNLKVYGKMQMVIDENRRERQSGELAITRNSIFLRIAQKGFRFNGLKDKATLMALPDGQKAILPQFSKFLSDHHIATERFQFDTPSDFIKDLGENYNSKYLSYVEGENGHRKIKFYIIGSKEPSHVWVIAIKNRQERSFYSWDVNPNRTYNPTALLDSNVKVAYCQKTDLFETRSIQMAKTMGWDKKKVEAEMKNSHCGPCFAYMTIMLMSAAGRDFSRGHHPFDITSKEFWEVAKVLDTSTQDSLYANNDKKLTDTIDLAQPQHASKVSRKRNHGYFSGHDLPQLDHSETVPVPPSRPASKISTPLPASKVRRAKNSGIDLPSTTVKGISSLYIPHATKPPQKRNYGHFSGHDYPILGVSKLAIPDRKKIRLNL